MPVPFCQKRLVDLVLYKILDNIVNEGICTYVGYRALPIFPVENERDYRMLDRSDEVRRMFADTNAVIAEFSRVSIEELQ